VPLTFERCPTTCIIHPNLLDDDDVANLAHLSLGTLRTVFCCRGLLKLILILILIAFITGNSSLEPLIEGLCAQIHVNLR